MDASSPGIDQQFEKTVRPFVGIIAWDAIGNIVPVQFDVKFYTNKDMVTDDLPVGR